MTAPELSNTDTKEPRRLAVTEAPFNPLSLCGSWGLYHSDERTEQVLVVGEPQPGIYLLEVYDIVTDEPRRQRIVKLDSLAKVDDDGGAWTFYDDHEDIRTELGRLMRVGVIS